MKLSILVPSEAYKSSAGARIRYRRLTGELDRNRIQLALDDLSSFDPRTSDCDLLLVSKCNDARALVIAAEMSRRGKLVGVDLFDDYFSERQDSRLLRHRSWFAQILRIADFVVCSTRRMAAVVRQYDEVLPVHLLNDPAPEIDSNAIAQVIADKVAKARDERTIRVGWFGVGDNRYFPVGLADLGAYGGMLSELARCGMQPQLTVLTNRRALTPQGLALIERLPIQADIVEWSESEEQALLEDSFAVFIPLSAQPFSVAKSLNRAVTALTWGCQVISVGYPLYSALDPLVYRSVGACVVDLARGEPKFSSDSVGEWKEILEQTASSEAEAARLARFLHGLAAPSIRSLPPLSLIHGRSTNADAHRLVQNAKGLSVASPYCTAPLDFDVIFRRGNTGLRMLVSREARERVLPQMAARRAGIEEVSGRRYFRLGSGEESASGKRTKPNREVQSPIPFQLLTYASTMVEIERQMTDAFGVCEHLVSEMSPLPFAASDRQRHDCAA